MRLTFNVPLEHTPGLGPHLQKVLDGEYDVPLYITKPTVLDLGANCGAFSVWASHRWPGCRISAYEPDETNFRYLGLNVGRYPSVYTFNQAIGTPGLRPFYDGAFNTGEASFHKMMNNPCPTGRHLEVLSPLVLPEADIIKIDTEGCEVEILRPLIEDGRSFRAILFEYHSESDRREIDSLLKDYHLVGSVVEYVGGRGVCRYLHRDLIGGIL